MSASVIRRKRSLRGFDPARRTRTRWSAPEMEEGERNGRDGKGSAPTLPDDILFPPPANHAVQPSPRRRRAVVTDEDNYLSVPPRLAMPASVIRRKRSRRGFDLARRVRTRWLAREMEEGEKDGRGGKGSAAPVLPDDMLLEVFKLVCRTKCSWRDVVICAAVCRRWCRVVAGGAGCLPAPPRHFGFFRNYSPSPLPPFVPTAGVALDIGFLPVPPACGAILIDSRGRRLLLRELGPGFPHELKLLVCSPLAKTSVRVPPVYIGGHRVAMCVLVPGEGAAFRIVVVLFGDATNHFLVLVYSSSSSAWECARGTVARALPVLQGPSVVVGDVVYKLQCETKYNMAERPEKYIMAVDAAKFTLAALPLPDAGMPLYTGNNYWIGKTADGRLCFFAIREQLVLVKWVLEAPGKWVEQQSIDLRSLMHPALVGDLANMKLSGKLSDQVHDFKLVSFSAFCEGTGMLFFVMADCIVSLDLKSCRMEKLWRNTDEERPLDVVYPCEMLKWPPALKDLGEA